MDGKPGNEKLILHVAVYGNDNWSGLLETPDREMTDGPLATIAGARDKVRAIRSKDSYLKLAEILVHGGMYEIRETLYFGLEDLGEFKRY